MYYVYDGNRRAFFLECMKYNVERKELFDKLAELGV